MPKPHIKLRYFALGQALFVAYTDRTRQRLLPDPQVKTWQYTNTLDAWFKKEVANAKAD